MKSQQKTNNCDSESVWFLSAAVSYGSCVTQEQCTMQRSLIHGIWNCVWKQNLRPKYIQLIMCLHTCKLIISLANCFMLERYVSGELCLLLHTIQIALRLNS